MADYEEHAAAFRAAGIVIVGGSTQSPETTRELLEPLGVSYPVLCSLDAADVAERFGAYTSERGFLHATAFVVRPDGTVELAVYSSGSRGRLTAADALEMIQSRQRVSA